MKMKEFRLLIVEDESLVRNNLVHHFPWETYGFRVCGEAATASEGIQLFEETAPDVVLLDYRLDDENGLDMLEEMRKSSSPFFAILLTGYSEFAIARRAIDLQVRAYLLKPARQDEIERVFTSLYQELEAMYPQGKPQVHFDPVLLPAIEYLQRHFTIDITLEELSSMCGVSIPYYCKLFKQNLSMSTKEYLAYLRIEKAKQLMASDLKMYEIADQVGYNDVRYFSRVFKAVEGKTPTEFRNETKV